MGILEDTSGKEEMLNRYKIEDREFYGYSHMAKNINNCWKDLIDKALGIIYRESAEITKEFTASGEVLYKLLGINYKYKTKEKTFEIYADGSFYSAFIPKNQSAYLKDRLDYFLAYYRLSILEKIQAKLGREAHKEDK